MPMNSVDLEQRVATLEAELAKLKAELGTASGKQYAWWKEIAELRRRPGLRGSHETGTSVAGVIPAETAPEEEQRWSCSTPST